MILSGIGLVLESLERLLNFSVLDNRVVDYRLFAHQQIRLVRVTTGPVRQAGGFHVFVEYKGLRLGQVVCVVVFRR